MKRIQIRFISLVSEKIFLAKRAHPSTGYTKRRKTKREGSGRAVSAEVGGGGVGPKEDDSKKERASSNIMCTQYQYISVGKWQIIK